MKGLVHYGMDLTAANTSSTTALCLPTASAGYVGPIWEPRFPFYVTHSSGFFWQAFVHLASAAALLESCVPLLAVGQLPWRCTIYRAACLAAEGAGEIGKAAVCISAGTFSLIPCRGLLSREMPRFSLAKGLTISSHVPAGLRGTCRGAAYRPCRTRALGRDSARTRQRADHADGIAHRSPTSTQIRFTLGQGRGALARRQSSEGGRNAPRTANCLTY